VKEKVSIKGQVRLRFGSVGPKTGRVMSEVGVNFGIPMS